jgi:3-deoxy-manno-octulosonate cytidylyltransferase (CMP-KDO synthetase)
MPTTIVIPARYGSLRFPGKPLVPIRGANGDVRPLIEWTWRAAIAADLGRVIIATDDDRIADKAVDFGAEVFVSDFEARNGTERVAHCVFYHGIEKGTVVNLQGDSLLIPPHWLRFLVQSFEFSASAVGTLVAMPEDRPVRLGEVSAVVTKEGDALWFSRSRLPSSSFWHSHYGVYCYKVHALARYFEEPPGHYEEAESLEQLRFIEQSRAFRISAFVPPTMPLRKGFEPYEVNNPEDVALVEKEMDRWNIS